MDRIDFRSDTVTWPTPRMREAMAAAVLGDDVYGEDPTVNKLQTLAAELVGKEAGLFVASGTMGNLSAIMAHARQGEQAIVGHDTHSIRWESGGMAAVGGVVPRTLPTDERGRMALTHIELAINDESDAHLPPTRLILLENSYGERSGYPIAPDYFAAVREVADWHGLSVHLDGARLFNAAVAQDIPATEITRHVDSVSFCLSKGLCAPVGSVLCGSEAFIRRAHRARKMLGGGMRQAGVLAAAGVVALEEMVERLADDHANARQLACGLAEIPGVRVDPEATRTNIVFFDLEEDVPCTIEQFAARLRQEANIWVGGYGSRRLRAVTHYWVDAEDVALLLQTVRSILS